MCIDDIINALLFIFLHINHIAPNIGSALCTMCKSKEGKEAFWQYLHNDGYYFSLNLTFLFVFFVFFV